MRPALALIAALLALPLSAHEIAHPIADCGCDSQCFTDEVSEVRCDRDERVFAAQGFPDPSHPMMVGITGTNQQFPILHNYEFRLPLQPEFTGEARPTLPGAIGVAVNGIPLFDPSTQGPIQAATGRPISAFEAGELDECGGHAGRGDDYHYHMAPVCLIEELGAEALETRRQPIGFAADGFPILALGWFDPANDIEAQLDSCRGIRDASDRYFYNVSHDAPYDILTCFNGATERGFSRDQWDQRQNAAGEDIVGIPMRFTITGYQREEIGGDICHSMSGMLGEARVRGADGREARTAGTEGTIFHCNAGCYGQFIEGTAAGPRITVFERHLGTCPAGYAPAEENAFLGFASP